MTAAALVGKSVGRSAGKSAGRLCLGDKDDIVAEDKLHQDFD